jgi:hypothetical protein
MVILCKQRVRCDAIVVIDHVRLTERLGDAVPRLIGRSFVPATLATTSAPRPGVHFAGDVAIAVKPCHEAGNMHTAATDAEQRRVPGR